MSNTPTAEELTRALTDLLDAHRKYDAGLASAMHTGNRSWDYSGREIQKVESAHETLATMLNAYIDSRVKAILSDIGGREHFSHDTLTLG